MVAPASSRPGPGHAWVVTPTAVVIAAVGVPGVPGVHGVPAQPRKRYPIPRTVSRMSGPTLRRR